MSVFLDVLLLIACLLAIGFGLLWVLDPPKKGRK